MQELERNKEQEHRKIAWVWALATTLSVSIGMVLGDIASEVFARGTIGMAAWGAVLGTTVGIAQWIILRWHVSLAGWWVLASIVGGALSFSLFDGLGIFFFGIGVGTAQWLVLTRQVFRAGWWLLASTLSFVGGLFLWAVLLEGTFGIVGVIVAGPVLGAVYGAVTGFVLDWLLQRRKRPLEDNMEKPGNEVNDIVEKATISRIAGLWALLPAALSSIGYFLIKQSNYATGILAWRFRPRDIGTSTVLVFPISFLVTFAIIFVVVWTFRRVKER